MHPDEMQPIRLSGSIAKITYSDKNSGFTVLKLKTDKELITVVGIFPFIAEGDDVSFLGNFIVHPTFGEQFKAQSFEKNLPSNSAAILRYLSSGAIRGIGPATARRIVERFGDSSLEILENEHGRLAEIKGISDLKANELHDEFLKQIGLRDVLLMLSRFKITPEEAMKIYKSLGRMANERIRENPYILCDQNIGFSFERAEEIATCYEIPQNSLFRIEAGIEYVLRANLSNGHTCLPEHRLLQVAESMLECEHDLLMEAYQNLCDTFKIYISNCSGREFVFLPEQYEAERYIAARICAMQGDIPPLGDVSELEIDYVENRLKVRFDELQRKAIRMAVETGVLVLTGGPGTGKTTILNAVINILERRNLSILLAAPTGRAAKRMSQLTGYEAKTIHRLLETAWSGGEDVIFLRDESNPLDCDVLIVDEMSMVDALLFEHLLRALRLSTRIILVGDADQLPSIGAGNVLQDILEADILPAVRLKHIFRQAKKSHIVRSAHAIINGEEVDFSREEDSDFYLLPISNPNACVETVISLCADRLPAAYGFSAIKDIQVLCPSRKLKLGSINLNNELQRALNPLSVGEPELFSKGYYFRVGDKVMQTKNDYDVPVVSDDGLETLGVYNGDIGIIESINSMARSVKVRYDNGLAEYTGDKLNELELAYAVTVHKSQGSEFDCVVLPLVDTPSLLRYRNLLYTAVTRAKKLLVLVGSHEVFCQMAENDRKTRRYTALKEFIEEALQ